MLLRRLIPRGASVRHGVFARGIAGLDSSKLVVEKTTTPKTKLPDKDLVFGATFSDHMLEIDWTEDKGWGAPKISAYHKLSLEPSAIVFHYSLECFEGMKAYIDKNGTPRLFRPEMNMARLNMSSKRIGLPTFDGDELLHCIEELVKLEKDWIPKQRGYSLYLRPTAIGTQESLGVGPTKSAKLFVICSPVGPYFKTGFAPVKLYADVNNRRAFEGGIGFTKAGGNYAPTIVPQMEAAKKGYSQVLWLSDKDHAITEVGTMNMFTLWINEEGEKELITAPLDGTILPGVTRDSILSLTRQWGEFKVSEKPFTMKQFTKAADENRIIESFGAGTACIVCPIEGVHYQGKDYAVPLGSDPNAKAGELTKRLAETILDIQFGEIDHEWSHALK